MLDDFLWTLTFLQRMFPAFVSQIFPAKTSRMRRVPCTHTTTQVTVDIASFPRYEYERAFGAYLGLGSSFIFVFRCI